MTAPLTPPDCDIRDWPSMLLDVARLRDSGLASDETPEACWAAVLLWAASWHQVPAGSIPDNDNWIAKQAGYAQRGKVDRAWARVRPGALRLFVPCADGRLYHPVVAEKALECWLEKLANRLSSGAGNLKRWGHPFDPAPTEAQMKTAREMLKALNPDSKALTKKKTSGLPKPSDNDPDGTPGDIPTGSQENGKEKGKGSSSEPIGSAAGAADGPVDNSEEKLEPMTKAELWRAGKAMLSEAGMPISECGEFVGSLVKEHGEEVVKGALLVAIETTPADPKGYLVATCLRLKGVRADSPKPLTVSSAEADATQALLAEQARQHAESRNETPEQREARQLRLQQARAVITKATA